MSDTSGYDDPLPTPPRVPPYVANPNSTGAVINSVMPPPGLGPRAVPNVNTPPVIQDPSLTPDQMRQRLLQRQYELANQLPAAIERDRMIKMQQARAAQGQGAQMDAMYRRAAQAPLPPNYQPQYKETPTRPPRFSPGDPAQAIVQPLALIAAIGGLFASRAGTASIRAMTGAMEGLREGNMERYNAYMQEFDEQVKAARVYNEEEHRKYADAWNNREKTLNERMSILQMLSTQYGNKAMGAALGSGNVEAIQAQLQALEGVSKVLDKMSPKPGQGHEMDHLRAEAVRLSSSNDPVDKAKGEELTTRINQVEAKMTFDQKKELEQTKGAIKQESALAQIQARGEQKIKEMEARGESQKDIDEARAKWREEYAQARHKEKMEELAKKLEKQGLLGGRKPSAADYARAAEIKLEHPNMTDTAAFMQAHRENMESEGKTGWSRLPPGVQMSIERNWGQEEADKLRARNFRMRESDKGKLLNSELTMVAGEKVAAYAALYPRSMGLVAQFMNTLRIQDTVGNKLRSVATYGQDSKEDAAAGVQIMNQTVADFEHQIGQRVTSGTLQMSDAATAIQMFKLLTQLALADAASMSTNGQGGTVYLDRRFTDVYAQTTSAEALMQLIVTRQEEANDLWRVNLGLDWGDRKDKAQRPFYSGGYMDAGGVKRANKDYIESAQFNRLTNLTGRQLEAAVGKSQELGDEVKLALVINDRIKGGNNVLAWYEQQKAAHDAGTLDDTKFTRIQKAVAIITRNIYGRKPE